ncbi:TPA: YveK family protein [Bacillus cereus]
MRESITLPNIFKVIKRKIIVVIFISILLTGIVGTISAFFIKPIYQASIQILINPKKEENYSSQVNTQLINTYNVVLKNKKILDDVRNKLSLDVSLDQLRTNISAQNEKGSQVISIIVQDKDKKTAGTIAQALAKSLEKEIPNLMNVDNINILSEAELSQNPIRPQPMLYMLITFIVSFFFSLTSITLWTIFDNKVKDATILTQELNVPVLAVVPKL